MIEGEAGIGKTTLARQFGSSVTERARLVWGPCDAAPTTPLQPFGRALDELLDADSDDFPSWLSHDPASLAAVVPRLADRIDARVDTPGGTVGDAGHYRLFDAVADALISAAREHPLIVILDDFQLAPPTTRRLVSRCVGSDAPLLLLATWRTGPGSPPWTESDAADDAMERITLDGLSEESIARWLVSLLGGDAVDVGGDIAEDVSDAAQWLHEQTGGNPLFVRELTTTLLDRQAFASGPGRGGFTPPRDVPEALREVLLDRVRGLAADTVAFLRAASVLGTRFRPSDLQALVDTSPARQIAEATSAGILRSGPATDEVEFTHDLVRRALYDTLSPGARVELHDLAAQAAADESGDGRLTEIAWHRLAAAPIDADAAIGAACRAGDASMNLFAFDEAARFYEGAQTAAGTLPGSEGERLACEMAVRRGDALRRAGDPANVDVLVEAGRCAESLDDPDLLARAALALCQLGLTTEAGGSDVTATDLADRALTRATDPRLRAEVAATASLLHSLANQPTRCRELFENAEREARATNDPEVLAVVLPYAYLALARPTDLDRRSTIADELIGLGEQIDHLPTQWEGHQLQMSVRLVRGDPAFLESFDRLATLTETLREPTRMWTVHYLAAAVAHVRGDLETAERQMTSSLEFAEVVATSRVMAIYGAELLAVRAQQGRLGELADTVAELSAEQPGVPAWHAAAARIAADAGDTSTVRRTFDRLADNDFAELPDDFTQTAALHALGRAAAAIDDAARSRLVYDRLASCSGLMSWFGAGTFGPLDQSLGECARAFGDRDSARRHLAQARDISTKLGAPLFAREAESALENLDRPDS
ncbi:MAG: AAA family ATPase [Acidimicrobiia bacterium]|nr:AAA family ATPase [Acidimicrobiia bacterium]